MDVAFFTEEEKQEVFRKLEEILRLHTDKVKKELQEVPIPNAEFISMMKISSRTAQNWRDLGIIEYYKIGEKIYYQRSAIQRMFDNHRVKSFR
jgi:GTPase SAR1 family protein